MFQSLFGFNLIVLMSRVGVLTVIVVFLYSTFGTVMRLGTYLPDSLPDNWLRDKLPSRVDTFDSSFPQFFTKLVLEEKIKSMQDYDSLIKCDGLLII